MPFTTTERKIDLNSYLIWVKQRIDILIKHSLIREMMSKTACANYETQHAIQIDLHECSIHQREITYVQDISIHLQDNRLWPASRHRWPELVTGGKAQAGPARARPWSSARQATKTKYLAKTMAKKA